MVNSKFIFYFILLLLSLANQVRTDDDENKSEENKEEENKEEKDPWDKSTDKYVHNNGGNNEHEDLRVDVTETSESEVHSSKKKHYVKGHRKD